MTKGNTGLNDVTDLLCCAKFSSLTTADRFR